MADEVAKIDDNKTKTLLGVTDNAAAEIKRLLVDSSTGRLKATATVTGLTFVDDETPSGTQDKTNKIFTIVNTPVTDSLKLYTNGQRIKSGGEDYTLSGTTITYVFAPLANDILIADYRIA